MKEFTLVYEALNKDRIERIVKFLSEVSATEGFEVDFRATIKCTENMVPKLKSIQKKYDVKDI